MSQFFNILKNNIVLYQLRIIDRYVEILSDNESITIPIHKIIAIKFTSNGRDYFVSFITDSMITTPKNIGKLSTVLSEDVKIPLHNEIIFDKLLYVTNDDAFYIVDSNKITYLSHNRGNYITTIAIGIYPIEIRDEVQLIYKNIKSIL